MLNENKSTARAVTPTVPGSQIFPQRAAIRQTRPKGSISVIPIPAERRVTFFSPSASYDQRFFEDLKIRPEGSRVSRFQKTIRLPVPQPQHNG